MRRSLQRAGILSVGILVLGLAPLFGWGETGDRLVTNRAVDTLPQEMQPFFYANRQFLVEHVGPAEENEAKNGVARHTDFIQLDHYGAFPFSALPRDYNAAITKFNRRVLDQYGILPWEIGFYSKKLTDAFREHDWNQVRVSAAILAHYVNAAHDPFNTTINMDGKLSAQPGVNERFSSGGGCGGAGIIRAMKAHVWVMLKSTVLDPQGQTIQRALLSLGYSTVKDVRQGKFFVLALDGLSRAEAETQVERIAKDVLTNPVIEEFRFEILD